MTHDKERRVRSGKTGKCVKRISEGKTENRSGEKRR
jgi:hypothetical protein